MQYILKKFVNRNVLEFSIESQWRDHVTEYAYNLFFNYREATRKAIFDVCMFYRRP